MGYIEPTNSPYSSTFFFIKKKDGSLWPVQDYCEINKWTICDIYPISQITHILEQLQGKTLFTALDIHWGYNNIQIKPENHHKAMFQTPYGLYQPNIMYFRLTNSPLTFQKMMDHLFRPLKDKYLGMLFVYMDDVLIMTTDDLPLHWQIIHDVLDLLEVESFFLKPSKCKFEWTSINYLGIVISNGAISIDPTKQDGLTTWPEQLATIKQVCSTLGVFGYQRPFIRGFANIAKPLTELTKKDTPFIWTPRCTAAIQQLKQIVLSDPVLQQPHPNRPYTLEVDASQYATGAILQQPDEAGCLRPIRYDSQTFNDAECGYDIHNRELLTVIRGLLAWHHLLVGSPHTIRVLTDHSNLKYYCHPQKISHRITRYLPKMAEFDFELIYKPSTTNKADHLSHCPNYDDGSLNNQNVTVLLPHLFVFASTVSDFKQLVLDAQLANPDLLHQWATHFNLTEANSAWYHGSALVVVEDNKLRREVLSLYHNHHLVGHPGISKTLDLLTQDYWWPTVKDFVTSYVKGCAVCQSSKANTTWPKAPPFPITPATEATPFETVAMDLITDLPVSEGFDTIFTITNHDATKVTIFIPCNKTIDALTATQLYMEHVFPYYGAPRKIISDCDPHFTAELAKELCHLLDIKQNISTAYHPQTDGQSEWLNQWLEQYVWIYTNYQQTDWTAWLPLVQYVHNSWTSSTMKKMPFDLLMGYMPRLHVSTSQSHIPEATNCHDWLLMAHTMVLTAIRNAQQMLLKHALRKKGQRHFHPFVVGQKVWLEGTNLKTSHPTKKFAPKRYGPFPITDVISPVIYHLTLPPS
jgi:RNase H-like domain found in reverse transcriptase/Integrase zinc binding domain/Reverse transcriptase (RNA-dependent DNA polymerase)